MCCCGQVSWAALAAVWRLRLRSYVAPSRGGSRPTGWLAPGVDGVATSYAPASGALGALVANHVMRAQVIFPGAGYLEMGREAACTVSAVTDGKTSSFSLI